MADHLFRKPGESMWYVRLTVPADVKAALGKTVFKKSTGKTNRTDAIKASHAILAQWQETIRQARKAENEPTELFIAERFEQSIQEAANIAEKLLLLKNLNHSGTNHIANDLESELEQLIDYSGSPMPGLMLKEIKESPKKFKQPRSTLITDEILERFREHRKLQSVAPKTLDKQDVQLKLLREFLLKNRLRLDFDSVNEFLSSLNVSSKTKRQYLTAGNTFWRWANKYVREFREDNKSLQNPFSDHELPVDPVKSDSARDNSWIHFTKDEVKKLHSLAVSKGDIELANCIKIAVYTGCRIEEIGRIKAEHITYKDGNPSSFEVVRSKTNAGLREVPISSKIAGLITTLLSESKDGYLFKSGHNMYDNRLDYMSKRFGRLKKDHFSKLHVFHSLRKSCANELYAQGALVTDVAYILGHKTGSLSGDIYIQGMALEKKAELIEKLDFKI